MNTVVGRTGRSSCVVLLAMGLVFLGCSDGQMSVSEHLPHLTKQVDIEGIELSQIPCTANGSSMGGLRQGDSFDSATEAATAIASDYAWVFDNLGDPRGSSDEQLIAVSYESVLIAEVLVKRLPSGEWSVFGMQHCLRGL